MANATVTVFESDGTTETDVIVLDVGRQAAAASKSAALSTEDKTAIDAVVTSLQLLDNTVAGAELQVDVVAFPSLPAGDNNIGDIDIAGGLVAHDAADSGSPVKIGGHARSSERAVVANDDRADLVTDLVGKLITLPYANPENFVSGVISSAMTGTTSTSLVAAPGAGLRNYITQITISNSHATVGTDVLIQDGSGGTTLYVIPAAAVYGGAVLTFPTPLRQPTTNTALFCANVTTGASVKASASGYKGV